MNVREAAAFLRISQDKVYELCRRKQIPHRRIGRRIVIPTLPLLEWLRGGDA
jgi:excisionase family DNA binding protein